MNSPAWNIVRKDFRLTRFYLLAWWGILVAGALLTLWNLNQIMQYPQVFYQDAQPDFIYEYGKFFSEESTYLFNWLVLGLDAVLLAEIVEMIVKADSPIDERANWRTRPVSGLGVWRAKLLYLALFCYAVPGAIQAAQCFCLGSDWADALHTLARFALLQSLLVAAIATAAVLFQRTFSGLLVFCGVAVAFCLLGAADSAADLKLGGLVDAFHDGLPMAWVSLSVFSLTGLVVSALIYAGRRRAVGGFFLGGGGLTAVLVVLIWPKITPGPLIVAPHQDDRLQLAFDAHPVGWMGGGSRNHPDWLQFGISTKLSLRGAPDTALHMFGINSRMEWPGTKLKPVKTEESFDGLFNLPGALASAGYGRVLTAPDPNNYPAATLLLSKEQIVQAETHPARWQGTVTGESGRLVVDWDVPFGGAKWTPMNPTTGIFYAYHLAFADGAQWTHNQSIYKVDPNQAMSTRLGDLNFNLWESSATNLPWMRDPPANINLQILLLYNPVKQQAILSDNGHESDNDRKSLSVYFIDETWADFDLTEIFGNKYPILPDSEAMRPVVAGQDRTAWRAAYYAWQRDRTAFLEKNINVMADWLAGARLVMLHFVPEHSIYNTVTVDSVQVITPEVLRTAGLTQP
jgi:hypothetical protein